MWNDHMLLVQYTSWKVWIFASFLYYMYMNFKRNPCTTLPSSFSRKCRFKDVSEVASVHLCSHIKNRSKLTVKVERRISVNFAGLQRTTQKQNKTKLRVPVLQLSPIECEFYAILGHFQRQITQNEIGDPWFVIIVLGTLFAVTVQRLKMFLVMKFILHMFSETCWKLQINCAFLRKVEYVETLKH